MTRKIRLFVEVDGLLIPVHIENENAVFEALQIKGFNQDIRHEINENIVENSKSSFRKITTDDIMKYLLNNLNEIHTHQSIASHFKINITRRNGEDSNERKLAYEKIYRNFKTARKRISKKMKGNWVKGKSGIKNQVITWHFKKMEAGEQKSLL